MKLFFKCCVLMLLFSFNGLAQNAIIHITIKNSKGSVTVQDPGLRFDLTREKVIPLPLDAHHSAVYTMVLAHPSYLVLNFSSDRYVNCNLFISPGDELFLTADFSKKNSITITGKGANNNQPEIMALTNMYTQPFNEDAAPNRVIAALNRQFFINKGILANYIKLNKPSPAFIRTAKINLAYFVPYYFYESYHNNIFGKPKEQQPEWQKIQDSLFSIVKLNNNEALTAYNYTRLIDDFVSRETGSVWKEYMTDAGLFNKRWLHSNYSQVSKLLSYAPLGMLNKLVIDHYFKGKTAEYAYSQALKYTYHKHDYQSAALLYKHFKKKYPASIYIRSFSTPMAEVFNKQQQAVNNKMIFLPNNGAQLNTFKEVLALNKGKTVFIDMWGTWCGPCREEIEKNSKRLRNHFAGNVTFLYIANFDNGRDKEWKKQIAYFQMEGQHILANSSLTKDIMSKVKATGYPTYILIKKDGSYKQPLSKYPVNINALMKEIEIAALTVHNNL